MLHQVQGVPQSPKRNAYRSRNESFLEIEEFSHAENVPHNGNLIHCQVIYKVEINYDKTLKVKSRIALHGNEYDMKETLKSTVK